MLNFSPAISFFVAVCSHDLPVGRHCIPDVDEVSSRVEPLEVDRGPRSALTISIACLTIRLLTNDSPRPGPIRLNGTATATEQIVNGVVPSREQSLSRLTDPVRAHRERSGAVSRTGLLPCVTVFGRRTDHEHTGIGGLVENRVQEVLGTDDIHLEQVPEGTLIQAGEVDDQVWSNVAHR